MRHLKLVFYVHDLDSGKRITDWSQISFEVGDVSLSRYPWKIPTVNLFGNRFFTKEEL